jgi:hypothetical protein
VKNFCLLNIFSWCFSQSLRARKWIDDDPQSSDRIWGLYQRWGRVSEISQTPSTSITTGVKVGFVLDSETFEYPGPTVLLFFKNPNARNQQFFDLKRFKYPGPTVLWFWNVSNTRKTVLWSWNFSNTQNSGSLISETSQLIGTGGYQKIKYPHTLVCTGIGWVFRAHWVGIDTSQY